MSYASTLLAGRLAAEEGMTDECAIRRKTGTATDPDTGAVTDTWATVYSGICKVQERQANAATPEAGSRVVVVGRPMLHLPISARDAQVGDVAEIIASEFDQENVGRRFRVAELPAGSQKTARRFPVEEAQT